MRLALLALAAYLAVGVAALEPTQRLLEDSCHPRLTIPQQIAAVVLWPISIWAADGLPSRC